MTSSKRDSDISADIHDDAKIRFQDILRHFETKTELPILKPQQPAVPRKPINPHKNKNKIATKIEVRKFNQLEEKLDRSSPSKTNNDDESAAHCDINEILRQSDTEPQKRLSQSSVDSYDYKTERTSNEIKKFPTDVLQFRDGNLQRVISRGKHASVESYESSPLVDKKYGLDSYHKISSDSVLYEPLNQNEFDDTTEQDMSKINEKYEIKNYYRDGFDSDEEIYSEPVFYYETINNARPTSSDGSSGCSSETSNPSNLQNVIRELYDTEMSYIRSLQTFIRIYMLGFDRETLPINLRNKKKLIFDHFEDILELHEQEFGPKLSACGYDAELVSNLFVVFLESDKFYVYVLYAMNAIKILELCRSHKEFFTTIQNESGDKLGVGSFLMSPIQRFLRYRLLLLEIDNQLKKQNVRTEINSAIANCSRSVFLVERFCDKLNEVQRLADIEQCFYYMNDEYCDPKFLLKPNELRDPINLNAQGKFLKMAELQMSDFESSYQYSGVLFLFEQCAIYTQKLKSDKELKLQYKGHYDISQSEIYCEESNVFDLWDNNQNHITFKFSKNVKDAKNMLTLLKKIVPQSEFNRTLKSAKKAGDTIWNKTRSFRKKISDAGFGLLVSKVDEPNSSEIIHTGHVKEKFTYLESLQTTEENYIKSLLELKSILFDDDWYLALFRKLSETCKNILAGILALHQQKLEPVIKEGNENEIFKHFEIHLGTKVFDLYQEFAVLAGQMKKMLCGETEEQSNKILDLLLQPLNRVKEYSCILENIDKNFECPDLDDGRSLQIIAEKQQLHAKISTLATKFSKIHQKVQENFKVHCLELDSVNLQSMGQVVYSDLVTLDKHPEQLRLFILQKSILCMSITQFENTESYDNLVFCEHHKRLKLKEDKYNNKCLKVKHNKVLFSTAVNRGKFTEQYNKLPHD